MKKLAVINGLRGYAILGVIYFHAVGVFLNPPGSDIFYLGTIPIFPLTFLGHGWLGVDLFFILSGFVLYLPYGTGRRELKTTTELWAFYKNRAERLLPLYYTVVIISVVFIVRWSNVQDWVFWREMLLMFTVTFNFTKGSFIPQCNYVLWSLGIEVLFSVVFPIIIWTMVKKGVTKTCLLVFYFSFIVRMVSCLFPEYNVAPHLNMIKDSLFGRLDDFIAGMLLCHWFITGWKQAWFERYSIAAFFGAMVVITIGCYVSDYISMPVPLLPSYFEPVINTVFQLGFGLLILSLLHMKQNALGYLFTNKFLQLTGMMCYSLYVWHANMQMVFLYRDYTVLHITSYCLFLFALSFLTYRYIEFGNKKLEEILPK